ncbi:MAG: alpha/beta hydrolase [Chloroflexota bacterium]|nr:alpha/beta hydrolase [Chloroflexota bacterium]
MKLRFTSAPVPATAPTSAAASAPASTQGAELALGQDVVRLRDGRALAYAEYGDLKGAPVFYFHGTPGSRLEGELLSEAAARAGIRLVAVDRPGFGKSDFLPGRRFIDWPKDVVQLADALGIQRFSIIGLSGGGPHALACARKLSHRLLAVTVVSGAGPAEASLADPSRLRRVVFRIAKRVLPYTTRMTLWITKQALRHLPSWMISRFPDPKVLSRKSVREAFRRDLVEAFRRGIGGAALEYESFLRDWGVRLQDIDARVHVWHGEKDRVVPARVGRYVAAAVLDARATFVPDGGHLMIVDIAERVFADLAQVG